MKETAGLNKKIFLQATGIVTLSIFISYLLGYIRDMLVMKWFGAGTQTDAWMIASQIPDLLFKFLLFGALGASFIPVFTDYLMQKKEKDAWEIASTIINCMALFLGFITILGIIGAPVLVKIIVPGFTPAAKILTVQLTRIVFPVILVVGLTGFIACIYKAYLRFILPAVISLLSPSVIIIFILFSNKSLGIFSLAYGTLAGTVLALMVLLIFFFRRQRSYKFVINLKHPAIKGILVLMIPLVGADMISKGGVVIYQIFASFLKEGSITSLTLANKLVSVPVILFSSSVSSIIFPFLSRQKANNNMAEFKDTILFGMRMMCLLLLPATVIFMVMDKPIIRLLFERGLFNAADTHNTAVVLFYLSIGILAYGINPIFYQACYALKKNWYLFRYEIIGLCLTVPLNYLFSRLMGLPGLALVMVTGRIVLVLYLGKMLSKELGGLNLKSLWRTFYKTIFSSLLMGGVCFIVFNFLNNILGSKSVIEQIIKVGGAVTIAAVFYVGLLLLFKVEEINKLFQLVFRKNL